MKKTLLTLFAIIGIASFCKAQDAYEKGNKMLNLGIGLNSYYGAGIPLNASFEVGTTDALSFGADFDYLSRTYNDFYIGTYSFTAIYIGARGSYHFNNLMKLVNISTEKLDLYAGATLGYRIFNWSASYGTYYSYYGSYIYDNSDYGSGVYFGIFVGAKYYFTPHVAVFTELGATGSSNVRLGVAFKF